MVEIYRNMSLFRNLNRNTADSDTRQTAELLSVYNRIAESPLCQYCFNGNPRPGSIPNFPSITPSDPTASTATTTVFSNMYTPASGRQLLVCYHHTIRVRKHHSLYPHPQSGRAIAFCFYCSRLSRAGGNPESHKGWRPSEIRLNRAFCIPASAGAMEVKFMMPLTWPIGCHIHPKYVKRNSVGRTSVAEVALCR